MLLESASKTLSMLWSIAETQEARLIRDGTGGVTAATAVALFELEDEEVLLLPLPKNVKFVNRCTT